MIADVTQGIYNDQASGAAAAPPRRTAGPFAGLPVAQAALWFARARHAGQRREVDHAAFIVHPVEVGSLLRRDGQSDEVMAAGLLHDVLEKTATTSAELHRRFGAHIAQLVESVSDDPSIGDYTSRKRELRDRVARRRLQHPCDLRGGQDLQGPRAGAAPRPETRRTKVSAELAHYRASLEMLRRVDGHVSLVDCLEAELTQLVARGVSGACSAAPIAGATGSKRTRR